MHSTAAPCENFIDGQRRTSPSNRTLEITNPATGQTLAQLPLCDADEVHRAVHSAQQAAQAWGKIPVVERARVLFRFRQLLEECRRELVDLVVLDNGKTLAEAQGEVQRGIEVVEFATGVPSHMMGTVIEDIARGIDCEMVRRPLGVVAGLTPFNFPVMVPLWMIPVAVACGNAFVLKPSERAPLAAVRLAELFAECGAPPGVLNVIHGSSDTAEALLRHPDVQAVSVVGSSPVAHRVYATAAAAGKRVQALGGAKNALVVAADAPLAETVDSIINSAFGCAGQRCLAGSLVIAEERIAGRLVEALCQAADQLRLGSGADPATRMGPVITAEARQRVAGYIERGAQCGGHLVRDGRQDWLAGAAAPGYFVGPTIFDRVPTDSPLVTDEIFGPLLAVTRAPDLPGAIETSNRSAYGNSASLYTSSGSAARYFRQHIEAGMIGINLGVPAPMAFFPFSGWKGSFFGDLHVQGKDGIEFYSRRQVITSRWGHSDALWTGGKIS